MLFERAVTLDPAYARAHLELGAAYATKADYLSMPELHARAVASLRRAIELQPGSARAWRELGSVADRDGPGGGGNRRDPAGAGHRSRRTPSDYGRDGPRALHRPRPVRRGGRAGSSARLARNPNAGWYALQLAHCAALLRDFPRGERAGRAGDGAAGGVSVGPRRPVHRRRVHARRPPGGAAGPARRGGRPLRARDRFPGAHRARVAQSDSRRAERAARGRVPGARAVTRRRSACSTSRSRASTAACASAPTIRSRGTTRGRATRCAATPSRRSPSSSARCRAAGLHRGARRDRARVRPPARRSTVPRLLRLN